MQWPGTRPATPAPARPLGAPPAACSASSCSASSPAPWGVVYAGCTQLIALKTRRAAATNPGGLIVFPLLFLTPTFLPRDIDEPIEVAAAFNPLTYLTEAMRR